LRLRAQTGGLIAEPSKDKSDARTPDMHVIGNKYGIITDSSASIK
jgi:hypothetical protein